MSAGGGAAAVETVATAGKNQLKRHNGVQSDKSSEQELRLSGYVRGSRWLSDWSETSYPSWEASCLQGCQPLPEHPDSLLERWLRALGAASPQVCVDMGPCADTGGQHTPGRHLL